MHHSESCREKKGERSEPNFQPSGRGTSSIPTSDFHPPHPGRRARLAGPRQKGTSSAVALHAACDRLLHRPSTALGAALPQEGGRTLPSRRQHPRGTPASRRPQSCTAPGPPSPSGAAHRDPAPVTPGAQRARGGRWLRRSSTASARRLGSALINDQGRCRHVANALANTAGQTMPFPARSAFSAAQGAPESRGRNPCGLGLGRAQGRAVRAP